MQLKEFRIQNYRSIEDSGPIVVSKLTPLLGRNESGKSNLLHALRTLNPVEGFSALNKYENFPRNQDLKKCTDSTSVVTSFWELSKTDKANLAKIWPRGKSATTVKIERLYDGQRIVEFPDISPQDFKRDVVVLTIQKTVPVIRSLASKVTDDGARSALEEAANLIEKSIEYTNDITAWANTLEPTFIALQQVLAGIEGEFPKARDNNIRTLEQVLNTVIREAEMRKNAVSWILERMPIFIFFDQYPQLSGYQNIPEYISRKLNNQTTPADENFSKMCKVAGLDPEKLQTLLEENKPEVRKYMVNQASAVITKEIQRLWKDRTLKVSFDVDGTHIHTFISNPDDTRDIEINLNDRSRGFQWFFSFYVTFAADTKGGDATNAILLLDEPGLYLHAKSQGDFLKHLEEDFNNQILYTTHSPFMVPTHNPGIIRTVNITKESKTTVSNDPFYRPDSQTLFPLQAALGCNLVQSLFISPNNLVVEGDTDCFILLSISRYLSANGKTGLRPDISITPSGSAQKIPYMVRFLSSGKLNILVLLDHERNAKATGECLIKNKLISDEDLISVAEGFETPMPKEADIEDLLDPRTYGELVRESYANELKGITLSPNENIPRIAKRFEEAFKKEKLKFYKTRPLRLLLTKMSDSPDDIMLPDVVDRFDRLNTKINDKFKSMIKRTKFAT